MYPWDCCRTCLSVQTLYPIFTNPEHNEKFTEVILTATGIKIEINDSLPQEMCSECITFINESIKFRQQCETSRQKLETRLNNKQFSIKDETYIFKTEKSTSIDISHLLENLENNDDFKDYDDNLTLDNFQYNYDNGKVETLEILEEQGFVETDITKSFKEKPVKRKVRTKEKSKEKEKIKEEIECEYCHKILTSRLSLRNHYKIHTGFDVVCEHCGKKFITRRLLLMHCRAKHGYEKTDKCSYCDYRASNAEQVKIHERLHTGEKPYVCKECNAGFHRKSSYLQHVAIHLPEKTVQCDQCTARFKSVTLMRIHKNRHRAAQYTFKCLVCDNTFARRRNVARHLQRIHALPPNQQHIDRVKIAG